MFPESKPLNGKRLVPQLAVGCVVFALLGLVGTFLVANLLQPLFHGDRAKLERQAQEREARGKHSQ